MKQITDHDVAGIATDPERLEAFYVSHASTVRAFLTRRLSDPHQVADLTADIFLRAIDSAHHYRPDQGKPIAWLLGIARNTLADSERRAARRLRAESRIVGRRLLDEDAIERIEQRIEAERMTRDLYIGLASLPRRERELMELVAIDGLPVVEAAEALGVQPGTARVRLHRIRTRLRNHLGDPSLLESLGASLPVRVVKEAQP